ncbi:MAG: RagB/SusD family nutrient uptake outer membrane protein [Bacteroidales bacterium]|nr:RagB/SusD family nutrient uptake outer membrane protein [Bacteroidales bacterium]
MKYIQKIAFVLVGCLSPLLFGSCDDWLTLLPEDRTVEEDFWKNRSQVESVVMSCYRLMQEDDVLQRIVWWGEMRSDNVVAGTAAGTDEKQLMEANILSSNSLTRWDGFYEVINVCNRVIERAPEVLELDNNFREDELQAFLSEALTLRSLAYFYLLRTFGDIPYTTQSSSNDAMDYNIPQTKEAVVVDRLLGDLKQALEYAPTNWGTDQDNRGRITKNAVRALMADIYLWKAAINEQNNPAVSTVAYDSCSVLCDAILTDEFALWEMHPGNEHYGQVFYSCVSSESIFELVFTSNGKPNNATSTIYGNPNKGNNPKLKAHSLVPGLFNLHLTGDQEDYDYRGKDYIEASTGNVFKYEGQSPSNSFVGGTYTYRASNNQANWIFYRLSDAYLMKAEALAHRAQSDEEMKHVLQLVNVVYKRACTSGVEVKDSLVYSDYASIADVQKLVLEERRREFLFEGKRWFDLLRKVRREGSTVATWDYIEKKYDTDVTLIKNKMIHLGAWYLPIHQDQMIINPELKQNEFYRSQED